MESYIVKFGLFLDIADLLFSDLGITPLLYGSLGLEYLTGCDLDSDDIDILVPQKYLSSEWDTFLGVLSGFGYKLIDVHEHTFIKDGTEYSFASLEELEVFAGISEEALSKKRVGSVSFRLMNLEQYLKVYTASIKDGYRINVRQKKDKERIEFILCRMEYRHSDTLH